MNTERLNIQKCKLHKISLKLNLRAITQKPKATIVRRDQGLSIQMDMKHCINFADNKNYLVGTVPCLRHCKEFVNLFKN